MQNFKQLTKRYFISIVLLIGLNGCDFQKEEYLIPNKGKKADHFAREFINKIISKEFESAFAYVDPKILDDKAKEYLTNAGQNIDGAIPKKHRVVEYNWNFAVSTNSPKQNYYNLGYEYEFEKGNILFTTRIIEKGGKLYINSFAGEFLESSLAEITKFTFEGKSILHFIFFTCIILVPLFIISTLVVMLISKITIKRKIIWTLVILLLALPEIFFNWGNGEFNFKLLSVSIPGGNIGRPNLYSHWILSLNIPIGAIFYWLKRKSLLSENFQEETEIPHTINNSIETETN